LVVKSVVFVPSVLKVGTEENSVSP
jgi:hypothetical protein